MDEPWVLGYDTRNCSIEAALRVVGEKWTFLVLREAFSGVRRFEDMLRRTGMPRQILSNRLSSLVDQGLLRKSAYREPGQRRRSEYRLTSQGLDLFPLLVALLEWGDKYAASEDGPLMELRHRDCGAPVRLQLGCTEGHLLGSARDVSPVPGPGARAMA